MSLVGDFVNKTVLRWAREIVESVSSSLLKQINIVQEEALSPLSAILQQVIGTMWIGEGADAFAEELTSMVIPGIGAVVDNIGWLNTGLGRAGELISAADVESLPDINEFGDICSNIFS